MSFFAVAKGLESKVLVYCTYAVRLFLCEGGRIGSGFGSGRVAISASAASAASAAASAAAASAAAAFAAAASAAAAVAYLFAWNETGGLLAFVSRTASGAAAVTWCSSSPCYMLRRAAPV